MDTLIGQNLGRYRIIEQLGEGGMAFVYKAFDPQLDREVAIKIIRHGELLPDRIDTLLKRFAREAKILAGLSHPNVVKVLDFGEEQNMPYLVMEYISGGSLKDFLKAQYGRPVPLQAAARMLAPIARALDAAHKHRERIIHRDIKPSNILIDKHGNPMLTDFGIAKFLESPEATALTTSGERVGTPHYMAPEQISAHSMDHRVDIYALGVVFFEMVTGQRPYQADTPMSLMKKKINEPPPNPTRMVPGLPEAIDMILLKSLALRPDDRYADMGELVDVLEGLAKGDLPKIALPVAQISTGSNHPHLIVFGGIGLLVLLATLGWAMVNFVSTGTQRVPTATDAPVDQIIPPTATKIVPIPSETSLPTLEVSAPVTRDLAELVFVPVGEFVMGSNSDEPYFWGAEAPKHTVYLDAFWIYRTEVTNKMYRTCVKDGKCPAPVEIRSHTHEDYFNNPEFDGYPVIYVTYDDAVSYCEWAGARLPTEAEWEKAARGEEGFLFPWGNDELQNDLANFCDEDCPGHSTEFTESGYNDGYRDVAPVGSYPAGASPFGALDMAGNVLEWVADWYAVDYYSRSPYENPTGPEDGTKHIIRGGSWWSLREGLRPAARASKSPGFSSDMVGFRCAVDAP